MVYTWEALKKAYIAGQHFKFLFFWGHTHSQYLLHNKGQYKALQILVGKHTDSGSILFHLTYTILCIPLTFIRHDGVCFLKKSYSPRHSPSICNLPKNIRQSNSLPCRFPQIPRLPETTARKTGAIPAPAADLSDTRQ